MQEIGQQILSFMKSATFLGYTVGAFYSSFMSGGAMRQLCSTVAVGVLLAVIHKLEVNRCKK